MLVEEQVAVIFAGVKGHLTQSRLVILQVQAGLLTIAKLRAGTSCTIRDEKALSEQTEEKLGKAIAAFAKSFS